MNWQGEGGSETYSFNVSDPAMATIDNEGNVVTTGDAPGEFMVRASMPKTPANFKEAQVRMVL